MVRLSSHYGLLRVNQRGSRCDPSREPMGDLLPTTGLPVNFTGLPAFVG
jgi:hypothetical protein